MKSEAQIKRDLIDLNFVDYEVKYPFCYKTKNEKDYFRYMQDGRFEHLWIESNNCSGISFGNYEHRIDYLHSEKDWWFKIVANRHLVIDNNEFEVMRNYVNSQYLKYLEGELYLSNEVQFLMKNKERKEEKKKENINTDDIITNDSEETPF